jgi:hypothetical protein
LGDEPVPRDIVDWAESILDRVPREQNKILVWVRDGAHDPSRNSTHSELAELCALAAKHGLLPVLFGDALQSDAPLGAVDMTLSWRLPLFQGAQMRRAQLQLFEHLVQAHGLLGQVGVTTAGMDGPALMGLPTMYITNEPNPRLGQWVGAIPGYEEVVRESAPLARIGATLSRWVERATSKDED